MRFYTYKTPSFDHAALEGSDSFVDEHDAEGFQYNNEESNPNRFSHDLSQPPEPPALHRMKLSFSDVNFQNSSSKTNSPARKENLTPIQSLRTSAAHHQNPKIRSSQFSQPYHLSTQSDRFDFNPQELDLPLNDDLWFHNEQAIDRFPALPSSKSATVERGVLFPWMNDSEIV